MIYLKGDSGSPLIQYSNGRSVVFGVLHGGDGLIGCSNNSLSYYSTIDSVIDWIIGIVVNESNYV